MVSPVVFSLVMSILLVVCVYGLLRAVKAEFFPEKHKHRYGVWTLSVNEDLLYQSARCLCGACLPIYKAVALGIPIMRYNTQTLLELPVELVIIAKEMETGIRKTHRCVI